MKPRLPIRRFDVFAEYTRLQALKKGEDDAHAKGYGLWVAKVVASGGGRRGADGGRNTEDERRKTEGRGEKAEGEQRSEPKWHRLGDEAQTDEMFDKEIVHRMGEDFYHQVFAPAIAEAFAAGKSYAGIRDTIRKEWKP